MRVVKIQPEKIVIFNRKEPNVQPPTDGCAIQLREHVNSASKVKDYPFSKRSLANLKKKKSSPAMSKFSKAEFKRRVLSMLYLSKPRTVWRSQYKPIFNFRQAFHTLTLPSKQVHSDVELKSALGLFLTNLRQTFDLQNYVWKAELQGNDNIHFHLVVDKYISRDNLLYYWNLQLEKLGYVDSYSQKFGQMTWEQYKEYRVNQALLYSKKPDFGKIRNAYNAGVSAGWRNPNTVDSRNVRNDKDVYNYLAKYLSKELKKPESDEEMKAYERTVKRFEGFGRLWASSRSLSRLKYQNVFEYQEVKEWIKEFVRQGVKSIRSVSYDYCDVIYFRIRDLRSKFRYWIYKLVRENARMFKYPVPV